MIEVRIRYSSEAESRHLCTWPVEQLDTLISTIAKWGVQDHENDNMSGQFVVPVTHSAHFEVVVHDDEDV